MLELDDDREAPKECFERHGFFIVTLSKVPCTDLCECIPSNSNEFKILNADGIDEAYP